MKKLLALILTILFASTNTCYAFSELYYLKNTTPNEVAPKVVNAYNSQKFNIIKQNPFYGTSQKNNTDYAVIILQQSGNNMFYYYNSNNNTKVNTSFLKDIKSTGIICEKSNNDHIIGIYNNLAQKVLNSQNVNQYSFDDTQPLTTPQIKQTTTSQTVLKGCIGHVARGSKIGVYLQNPINTATAHQGDQIIGVLTGNWDYNGYTVAPQGSIVYGTLTKAHPALYGSRNGRVVINFNQIVTPSGKTYNISTEAIDFSVTNDGKLSKTVKNAAKYAAVGAALGLLFGALSSNSTALASAAIGAGVGAGASAIQAVAERGIDAEIPSFTELELTLTKSLNVTLSN